MKEIKTISEAIEFIFSKSNKEISNRLNRTYFTIASIRSRYLSGVLTLDYKHRFIIDFGFEEVEENRYKLKTKKNGKTTD